MNIFKKSKGEKKKFEPKLVEKKQDENKTEAKEKSSIAANLKGDQFSFQIIKGPHITEKASALNNLNQYVFKVFGEANKIEIKKAVERLYSVKVEAVRILMMPSKQRKLGQTEGLKAGFKKAIVKLAKEYKIDIIPR